jgi:hypothetical protein
MRLSEPCERLSHWEIFETLKKTLRGLWEKFLTLFERNFWDWAIQWFLRGHDWVEPWNVDHCEIESWELGVESSELRVESWDIMRVVSWSLWELRVEPCESESWAIWDIELWKLSVEPCESKCWAILIVEILWELRNWVVKKIVVD